MQSESIRKIISQTYSGLSQQCYHIEYLVSFLTQCQLPTMADNSLPCPIYHQNCLHTDSTNSETKSAIITSERHVQNWLMLAWPSLCWTVRQSKLAPLISNIIFYLPPTIRLSTRRGSLSGSVCSNEDFSATQFLFATILELIISPEMLT